MHTIFFLFCCLALICSTPIKAEDERPNILFPRPIDLALSDTYSNPKINVLISKDEDETPSLSESQYSSATIVVQEDHEPQSSLQNPVESALTNGQDVDEQDLEKTWAKWEDITENLKNEGTTKNSDLVNINSTTPYTLTNSAESQEPTNFPNYQAPPTSYESILFTGFSSMATSAQSTLDIPSNSASVKSSDDMIQSTAIASLSPGNVKSESSVRPTLISTSDPVTIAQSSALTSSVTQSISSVLENEYSSSSKPLFTGSGSATTLIPELSGSVASSAPYPGSGLNSSPSNSTVLSTTSYEPTSTLSFESTSTLSFESTSTLSFESTSIKDISSSYNFNTKTTSNPVSSVTNATQTIVTTSYSLTLTSTGLHPLPTNGSASTQSSTDSNIFTSGTAIYSSLTSSLLTTTSNGTATSTPGFSTITIPLLTSTPYQSSSLTHNTTYTSIPPSNYTLTYSNLPSSTPTSIKTSTLSTTPTIIIPTATNTASTFIPSSIIAQTSSTHSSGQSTQTVATGIPSALPKIVQNPLGSSTPAQPEDTSEVQIGFEWALNYPFVVSHPLSTTQIFMYLPIGIADGLGLKPEQIVVKNLLPLDTTADLHFITTVARVFIPSSMVDTLRVDLGIAASPIYQNPDESVNTLMNYINPAIPFFPGAVLDLGATSTGTRSKTTQNASPGDAGVFNTATQQTQSASAKGTTAGIALAACGGAAAYGAAMFLLARRYKHRQQRLNRPDSMGCPYETGEGSPTAASSVHPDDNGPLMSGGRFSPTTHDRHSRGSGRTGHATRNAQISAPMMAENSLGWS